MSIGSEDSRTIAPPVIVAEIDSFLERVSSNDLHHRTKDLLIVAIEARAHIVNDRRADEVALGIARDLDTTAIKQKVTVLSAVLNQTLNFSLVFSVVQRSNIRVINTSSYGKSL